MINLIPIPYKSESKKGFFFAFSVQKNTSHRGKKEKCRNFVGEKTKGLQTASQGCKPSLR